MNSLNNFIISSTLHLSISSYIHPPPLKGDGPDQPKVGTEGLLPRGAVASSAHNWSVGLYLRNPRHVPAEDRGVEDGHG